jgi:2-polyprenyl-3-methyl-5-hydroxy-6-metoxy-1,4-benzoquinol methylase
MTMATEAHAEREAAYFKNHQRRNTFPWSLYHRDLQRRVGRALAEHGPAPEVLVVGCGLEPFVEGGPKDAVYSGCDLDPRAIERCQQLYPSMRERLFVCAGPYELFAGSAPQRFDVIIAKEVIEHVPEPARWARELARYVRPGGELILTTPNYSLLSSLAFLEYTVLEAVARRDGYSRLEIHPSKFTPRRLKQLNPGPGMRLVSVERTWTNWALVGRWKREE